MKTMTVDNVRSNIDSVLDAVAAGERIEIMRGARHFATIDPAPHVSPATTRLSDTEVAQLLGDMNEFAKGNRLDGLSIRDLVGGGRSGGY